MLVHFADHAKAIDRLVVDEGGIRRARLGVVLVVVAGPVTHVRGEVAGKAVLAVALDEVHDVVRDQRREPADAVAHLRAWPDVRRRGDHDRHCARIATRAARPVA